MTENAENRLISSWNLLGGPEGGSVYALALTGIAECTAFAATSVGIFRSTGNIEETGKQWERLADSPGKVMSIAISPNFQADQLVVAGNRDGVFISADGGKTWQGAEMPRSSSAIQGVAFSPSFMQDGVILAGTEEDGVLVSEDRGRHWVTRNFGFLDPCIFALVISPNFSNDETAFAGTGTGLYRTYNSGRAWREVVFPGETGPVLALGISPSFKNDGVVFAGTEDDGLLRSIDRGKTWQTLPSPGTMINAIQVSSQFEQDHKVFITTENGVYCSVDGGNQWTGIFEIDSAVCLAATSQLMLVGLADNGVFRSTDLDMWERAYGIFARTITTFKLSPNFDQDEMALSCGPGEGIWRSTDGGRNWACLDENLPGLDVFDVVFSPAFRQNHIIYAASSDGVLISHDSGDSWEVCYNEPVSHLTLSPSGDTILAGTAGQGVVVSRDSGYHWEPLAGPWEIEGDIQAVGLGSDNQFFIASVEPTKHNLEIGMGRPGQWHRIFSQPSTHELVFFWIPTSYIADNIWYASTGSTVWRIGLRKDITKEGFPIRGGPVGPDEPLIFSLSGTQSINTRMILASTGKTLYRSTDGVSWQQLDSFGDIRMIATLPSPSFKDDKTLFSLSLGGLLWKGIIN